MNGLVDREIPAVTAYDPYGNPIIFHGDEYAQLVRDIVGAAYQSLPNPLVVHVRRAPFDLYIGRDAYGFSDEGWGNPYPLLHPDTPAHRHALLLNYTEWLLQQRRLMVQIRELRGLTLGCWCSPKLCHGHVLSVLPDFWRE